MEASGSFQQLEGLALGLDSVLEAVLGKAVTVFGDLFKQIQSQRDSLQAMARQLAEERALLDSYAQELDTKAAAIKEDGQRIAEARRILAEEQEAFEKRVRIYEQHVGKIVLEHGIPPTISGKHARALIKLQQQGGNA